MSRFPRGFRFVAWPLLLMFGLVCLCLVTEDVTAVERPTDPGPYEVGFFDVNLTVTVDGYPVPVDCRYYYPATSTGEWMDPDPTGAPYPPIIYHIYAYGRVRDFLNRTNDRERLEFVVSHGFVILTFTPFEPVSSMGRSYYNDFVNYTDAYDVNASSPLFGMVKKDSYGALGEFYGGSLSWIHGAGTDRITAVHSLGPYFGIDYSEDLHGPITRRWNNSDGAWMVQKGSDYTTYERFLSSQYEHIEPDKIMVRVPGRWQNGAYRLDLVIAFFKFYLGGEGEYETYLYGDDAKNEVFTGQYGMEFNRTTGENFTWDPTFSASIPPTVYMDDDVAFEVACDSHILLDDPTVVHEWYVGDEEVPYYTSTTDQNATVQLTEPGRFDVWYVYYIGLISISSNILPVLVTNVAPVADAGPDRTIYQDEPIVLDGSGSSDTASDIDRLEYNWTFEGKQTPWSNEPTYVVDTSSLRKFTAYLVVRDRHGKFTQDSVLITIVNRPPQVLLVCSVSSCDEDEMVELTGAGNDSASHIDVLEYRWSFGDGHGTDWSFSPATDHTYTMRGTYTVTVWVRDPLDERGNDTIQIIVENVIPTGGIDLPGDGSRTVVGSRLVFTGWGHDTPSDNDSLWLSWDFGDEASYWGPDADHAYREPGRYTVTLTVEDDDGASAVVTLNVTVRDKGGQVLEGPVVYTVSTGLLALIVLGILWVTEPGRYWFGLASAPLFTKTKDVMDNKTRYALHGIIMEKPGIHYSAIREEFGLANGAAAYHLYVLEREEFIRSVRDGKLKRFYSTKERMPEDVGRSPEETRDAIVDLVGNRPDISQLEVMEELDLERNEASYYLRDLVKEGRLEDRKEGKFTVYKVNERQ